MKKKLAAGLMMILCIAAAAGCGGKDGGKPSANGAPGETEINGGSGTAADAGKDMPSADGTAAGGEQTERMTLRIVDGAESGNLVLAGEGAGEVYTLSVGDAEVYLDGAVSLASVLEDGMLAEIRYTGGIEETFPAQIGNVVSVSVYSKGTEQNPLGVYYDLCGLYLEVLDDLWDKDSGLNEGAAYVSVDLSEAPGGLTEGEKWAVAWIFADTHNAEALMLTYEELAEQGYLSEYGEWEDDEHKAYEWTDGVLFSITERAADGNEVYSLPVLKFDAEKWRSPLGAYYLVNCGAVWSESGSWESYTVEAEAIS